MRQFKNSEAFYGTLFHEMIHSTGAKDQLDRFSPSHGFGSSEYAREELVAELGSALTSQRYGMTKNIKEDSCAYLKSWLTQLKESPQFIKTTLLDVKKATSMLTQVVDKVSLDLEESRTNNVGQRNDSPIVEELSNEGIKKDVEEVDETHETEDIERRSSMRR